MGLREDKKRELRERILATTLSLFGERGFGGTRVADIAARLSISEATFFNYFPTKQAVLKSAVRDVLDEALARGLAAPHVPEQDSAASAASAASAGSAASAASAASAVSASHAIGAEVAVSFDPERPLMRLLAAQPEVLAAGFLAAGPPAGTLTAMFTAAQDRGEVRADAPAAMLAQGLLAALGAGVCGAVGVRPGPSGTAGQPSLGAVLDRAVDVFTTGLGPH